MSDRRPLFPPVMRQGKCSSCHVAYRWPARARKLEGAFCPRCGHKLRQTTYRLSWPWHEIAAPLSAFESIALRRGGTRAEAVTEPAPARVYLVGCSAAKLDRPAQAQELYTSQLFRAARGYARERARLEGVPWAILSSVRGVVLPETIVAPYDCRLEVGSGADVRRAYAYRVSAGIRPRGWHRSELVILAGRAYTDPLRELFADLRIVEPLRGLQVGERLRFFNAYRLEREYREQLERCDRRGPAA